MNLHILNAATLNVFTEAIRLGFHAMGVTTDLEQKADATLLQIHGSLSARDEDHRILERAQSVEGPKAFLIHRPDEALQDSKIQAFFARNPELTIIFLGDLIFRIPFWEKRRKCAAVIAHPQLGLTMPKRSGKFIVGAYTGWGEMRDVRHYLALVEHLRPYASFDFWIGGTGLSGIQLPSDVKIINQPFVPHFNVQLYHLNGEKRFGESSGSLHRGISIPVIFEANGAERLEDLVTIKIQADDKLNSINYTRAAKEIGELAAGGFEQALAHNRHSAERNSPMAFALAVLRVLGFDLRN